MNDHWGNSDALKSPADVSEPPAADHNAPGVVASAMLVGTAALFILGLQPILLGGLAQAGRLSEAGLGIAATIEVLALALGAGIGPRLLNRGGLRWKTAAICLLLAMANGAVHWAISPGAIYAGRGMAGLLEGLALGAALVVLTHTRQPDRISGLFLAIQTIPQMVAAYLIPVLLIPRWGVESGFVVLAIFGAAAAIGARGLIDKVTLPTAGPHGRLMWTPAVVLLMVAVVGQNAGIGAAWNYVDLLAHQRHYPAQAIGLAVAGSLGFQVLGAFFVAWIGWRLPYQWSLILGALVQVAVVLSMIAVQAPAGFVLATCLFGLFWLALQPFQVQQAIAVDHSRQVAILLTPLALIGLSLGPLVASTAVSHGDVGGGFRVGAAMLAFSALSYGGVWLISART